MQLVVPAWVTVTVRPATRKVPVRALAPVLLDTENVTEPLPVPEEPGVRVSHVALLAADHVQPLAVVIATVAVPAGDGSDTVSGETL